MSGHDRGLIASIKPPEIHNSAEAHANGGGGGGGSGVLVPLLVIGAILMGTLALMSNVGHQQAAVDNGQQIGLQATQMALQATRLAPAATIAPTAIPATIAPATIAATAQPIQKPVEEPVVRPVVQPQPEMPQAVPVFQPTAALWLVALAVVGLSIGGGFAVWKSRRDYATLIPPQIQAGKSMEQREIEIEELLSDVEQINWMGKD